MISRFVDEAENQGVLVLVFCLVHTNVHRREEHRKSARLTIGVYKVRNYRKPLLTQRLRFCWKQCVCVLRWFLTHAACRWSLVGYYNFGLCSTTAFEFENIVYMSECVCVCVFDWRSHANFKLFSWLVMNVLGAKKAAYQYSFRRLDISERLCASYIIIIMYT